VQYIPVNQRKMRAITKGVAIVAGSVLLILGGVLVSVYTGAVGAIILIAVFFKKVIFLDEQGVVVSYRLGPLQSREVWEYSAIESVHVETRDGFRLKAMHFKKGLFSKILIFPSDEVNDVVIFIKKHNPQIFFSEAS
jgi:hypothetical protein